MKRRLVPVIALFLIAALALTVFGCGGGSGGDDTAKAKEYMEKADQMVEDIKTESEDIESKMEDSFPEISADASYDEVMAAFEQAMDALDEEMGKLEDQADEAEAEYKKIADLSGVDDYKEYASIRIEQIGIFKEIIDITKGLYEDLYEMMQKWATNPPADPETEMFEFYSSFMDEASSLNAELEDLDDQAEDLKKEKDL